MQARLSERNIVELVNKLKQLGILGDELLYTTNGLDYITTDRLREEMKEALTTSGGRLPLVKNLKAVNFLGLSSPPWRVFSQ